MGAGRGMVVAINRESLPDYDPTVMEAFAEGRQADDIWVIPCSMCNWWSYYNEGSHATCRNCGIDLTRHIDEDAVTMADYWNDASYPCDMETI